MKKLLAVLLCILVLFASVSCVAFAAGSKKSSDTDSPSLSSLIKILMGNSFSGYGKVIAKTTVALRDATADLKDRAEAFLAWFTRFAEPFNNFKWKSIFR